MDRAPAGVGVETPIEWREWGEAAFAEARAADAPILLSLTATWCDHCHEMDAETYAVPAIAAHVADGFVPVRVDVDRRPRVRDRYNVGGFPSTVFCTPDGEVIAGAGYLEPDGLRQVLERVRERWADSGDDAGRIPRALGDDEPPTGELTPAIESGMLAQLEATHDERAGGWGEAPKFPIPDAIEFALKRDREMARRCLDAVSANLLDEHEGGFYRFALERDWSGLQREKLLDANAALLRAFANAYLTTGSEAYRRPAERTLEYLTTTLWRADRNAFAASQVPGETAAYTLEASDREAAPEPPIDPTIYAGANALAVDALCTYAAYTDDDRARRYAERTLETLREEAIEDGAVAHALDAAADDDGDSGDDGPDAAETPAGVSGGERCLLATQARTLRALTTARSVLGAPVLQDARAVADATIDRLRDGASFVDGPTAWPGLLERPLRPLDENARLADALLDLAVLTGEARYRTIAREALGAFAGAGDRLGVQVAGYASAVSRALEAPLVVRVGAVGSDLHRAAFRLADHEKVVVPDADDLESGAARVERGDRESALATTPEELSERVRSVLG